MSLEVQIDEESAIAVVAPDHGRRVVFEVRWRRINVSRSRWRNEQWRYVVGLKGSDGEGFGHHTSFERAVRSMLWRARRYHKAFSVERAHQTTRKAAA